MYMNKLAVQRFVELGSLLLLTLHCKKKGKNFALLRNKPVLNGLLREHEKA